MVCFDNNIISNVTGTEIFDGKNHVDRNHVRIASAAVTTCASHVPADSRLADDCPVSGNVRRRPRRARTTEEVLPDTSALPLNTVPARFDRHVTRANASQLRVPAWFSTDTVS